MPSTQTSTSATIKALKAPERFGRAMARAAGARRSPRDAGKSPRRTDVVTVRGAGRAPEARPPAERPAAEDAAEPKCAREVGRTDGAGRDEAGRIGADAGRRDGEALRETPPRALPREVEPGEPRRCGCSIS